MTINANPSGRLENYKFSGLNSSLIGAFKSVADYYNLPLSSSWIYGMTGHAFLFVLNENLSEPNGGPPDEEGYRLVRNIGIDVSGKHVHAEGEEFRRLQSEAWENARLAIDSNQPVFAKKLDQENQTTVVYAYDKIGYYTHSWHVGFENFDDVLPWNSLGLSCCPCVRCKKQIESSQTVNSTGGLISLHWAKPCEAIHEKSALKEALEFVFLLNKEGSYQDQNSGGTYLVGTKAYEQWLTVIDNNSLDKYYFSLFIEILHEARGHAVQFLEEMKERSLSNTKLIEDGIQTFGEIASRFKILNQMYPYKEPPGQVLLQKEACVAILKEIMKLEKDALTILKDIHKENVLL